MFTTIAEFNGLSSASYRNGIIQSQLMILAKIQPSVICTHIVDFCRPGHIHNIPSAVLCLFSVVYHYITCNNISIC